MLMQRFLLCLLLAVLAIGRAACACESVMPDPAAAQHAQHHGGDHADALSSPCDCNAACAEAPGASDDSLLAQVLREDSQFEIPAVSASPPVPVPAAAKRNDSTGPPGRSPRPVSQSPVQRHDRSLT